VLLWCRWRYKIQFSFWVFSKKSCSRL